MGLTDVTIAVFIPDHGEMAAPTACEEVILLPLIISHPDVEGGRDCGALTGHIDVVGVP